MSIYVTSDWHFNHKNIVSLCRPQFSSIEEHNDCIAQRFNEVVGKDDLVYVLGDVGFTPASKLAPIIRQLNGRKILLIGNHDVLKDSEYLSMGFIEVVRHPIYYSTNIILSHIPVKEAYDNPWVYNIHGHLHNGALDLPNFINANVENWDYRPVDLKKLEADIVPNCRKTRFEPYKTEWYAAFEQKKNA